MKLSEFKNNSELLTYFGIKVQNTKFLDFEKIQTIAINPLLSEDLDFLLTERGNTDKEFYACEALIFPLLKEAWKRNPKAKLFSHPQIKYEDLVLVPDYVVTPKDKSGTNTFQKPLLITVYAPKDNYQLAWDRAYKELIIIHLLNENKNIPIYLIITSGTHWEFGKFENNIIYQELFGIGLDNPNKLLGVLDFIFADCVRTAEKYDMY